MLLLILTKIIVEDSSTNGDCNTNNGNYNKPYNNMARNKDVFIMSDIQTTYSLENQPFIVIVENVNQRKK